MTELNLAQPQAGTIKYNIDELDDDLELYLAIDRFDYDQLVVTKDTDGYVYLHIFFYLYITLQNLEAFMKDVRAGTSATLLNWWLISVKYDKLTDTLQFFVIIETTLLDLYTKTAYINQVHTCRSRLRSFYHLIIYRVLL
jgi:hypothetical protein